jgi:preprotein translocase subunit SecY
MITGAITSSEILRAVTYLASLSLMAMVFSVLWISTSGMDAASVAEQIEGIGMQIPGYRSDKKTMGGVLNRYIPALAVLGGLAIGLLAAFADFTGAIGTGTGILLTVMIVYNYYEELSAQPLEDAHPWVRKILE